MGEFVVVVADNWWRAKEALRDVSIEWDSGKYAQVNSAGLMKLYREGLSQSDAAVARQDGNTVATLEKASKVIEAEYYTPYLAHATLEPMVCTAWLQDDQLQIWVSTQNPESSLAAAASTAEVPQENVKVFAMQMGGGLGRKSPQDFTRQTIHPRERKPFFAQVFDGGTDVVEFFLVDDEEAVVDVLDTMNFNRRILRIMLF